MTALVSGIAVGAAASGVLASRWGVDAAFSFSAMLALCTAVVVLGSRFGSESVVYFTSKSGIE
jgi:predicted MFS family arabinose efflux permease